MAKTTAPLGGRREEIKRAAAALMADLGYERASMSDFAAAVGITKASLYYHFASKQMLLFELLQEFQAAGERVMALVEERSEVADRMQCLVAEHIKAVAADPLRARLLARELRSLEGDNLKQAKAHRTRYENFVVRLIEDGQREKVFRADLDARVVAMGVLSMMNALPEWFRPGRNLTVDHLCDTYGKLILGGLLRAD